MIVNSFPFSSHNSYLLSMTKQYCIQFFVHSNCGECIPDFGCSKFVTGLIGDVKFVLNVGISWGTIPYNPENAFFIYENVLSD